MPNTKKITKPTWQLNHRGKGKTLKKHKISLHNPTKMYRLETNESVQEK